MPFGFGGGLLDADTGLVHLGYREYDPRIGRFVG
ncbi:RHS repeat-associated core domain-containing protein [Desulfovibrio subterraneus]